MAEFPLFPTVYWAEQNPQGVALVWKKGETVLFPFLSEQISWAELQSLLQQAVKFLPFFAPPKGELFAYSGTDKFAGLLCYLAALQTGAKILMLNPAMPDSQRQQVLQQNGVSHLITDHHFTKISENLTACRFSAAANNGNPHHFFDPQQPATLTLTSGSSGTPKAVVHSIQNHLANAEGVCELMAFTPSSSWLLTLPLFHVSGQGIVWRWLLKGACLHLVENKADFWQALAEVSHASLVPTQLQRYLSHPVSRPQQKMLLGGANIPAELIAAAQQQQIDTFAGYGMTEMASTICAVQGETDNVGSPLKGREVRIEQGEIWVRGAGLGLGYWLNQRIVPLTNSQGWFATKDKGEWRDGKLVVSGRLDNQFISGGENIQPEQVEKVLFQSGQIKQVFVVPLADTEFGQRPVAFVEFIEPFSQQAVKFLQNFASQHLEKFKLPVHYFPLDTAQQQGFKISRKQLQQQLAAMMKAKESNA